MLKIKYTSFLQIFNHLFLSFVPIKYETDGQGSLKLPSGGTYLAWRKAVKIHLRKRGKSFSLPKRKRKPKKRWSKESRVRVNKQIAQRNRAVEKQLETIINDLETSNYPSQEVPKEEEPCLELITVLKKFLEQKKIPELIEAKVADHRNGDFVTYSKGSIVLGALAIFLFRMGSGNKYDCKSHDKDEKYSQANMAKFINAPDGQAPIIKTIELFLRELKNESINELMIDFFKDLQNAKFFRQHPQIMPGDFFLLAADCVHLHTYDHAHHKDKDGNNDCEYCLKRVYGKGTEKEKAKWMHCSLMFSFIFFGKLKIPIYKYPIHAKQASDLENASDDKHKQECELIGLKNSLPVIRAAFPRMQIVLLLDGLYANRPVIKLAAKYNCGYIIVRKEGSLTTLEEDCNKQAELTNCKKNCVKNVEKMIKGWRVKQRYEWFNGMYLGEDITTNVLRLQETRTREDGKEEVYKSEWLFSRRISANSCEEFASQARARWQIEDLFNTLKNRGFKVNHDYSRHPNALQNWHGLALFAFGIFELYRFSTIVEQRHTMPIITLVEKLLAQLTQRPTEEIFNKRCLEKRIQFRYDFSPRNTDEQTILPDDGGGGLKAA